MKLQRKTAWNFFGKTDKNLWKTTKNPSGNSLNPNTEHLPANHQPSNQLNINSKFN
jgi:hypothetical protein